MAMPFLGNKETGREKIIDLGHRKFGTEIH